MPTCRNSIHQPSNTQPFLLPVKINHLSYTHFSCKIYPKISIQKLFDPIQGMDSPPENMVHHTSKSSVKPSLSPQATHRQCCNLTPWDLNLLSANYIQWGLLFSTLCDPSAVVRHLKTSLSEALLHFHPLAGRLVTQNDHDGMSISIDSNKGDGAEFIHAIAEHITIADILAPLDDVPSFIPSFFPLNGAVNYDGHFLPLLAMQVTELADGIFIGCSFNHTVGDGASFWKFFNTWAQNCRIKVVGEQVTISHQPIHNRWFMEGVHPPIKLPFTNTEEFIERYSPPPFALRERIFHFSPKAIAQLKSSANNECRLDGTVSSFQALCSLLWRSVVRARRLPLDQLTTCRMAADNRSRLRPPLPEDYFGNAAVLIVATATVGELLGNGLGWGAFHVHRSVAAHTDSRIHSALREWAEGSVTYRPSSFDQCGVTIGSSPRFDVCGCDFGWGKPVALWSGGANKYDGKLSAHPGMEGGGSVDLEVCLWPEAMAGLLRDKEFMSAVSQ